MISYKEFYDDVMNVVLRNFNGANIEEAMNLNLNKWQTNKTYLHKFLGEQLIYKSEPFLGVATDELVDEAFSNFIQELEDLANSFQSSNNDIISLIRVTSFNVNKEGFLNNILTYGYASPDYYDFPKPKNAFYIEEDSKYSKSMKFFIKEKEMLRRIQDLYSTYTQKLTTNKKMMNVYLSIHPLDYLTVSENKYGWRSCHALSDGDYRGGNFNYMVDKTTLVAYIMEDKDENLFNDTYWPMGDVQWNSKIWRCLVHLNEKGIIINTQYPYKSDVFLNQLEVVLDKITDNTFTKKEDFNKPKRVTWNNIDNPMFYSDLDNNNRGAYIKELKDEEVYRLSNGILGYSIIDIGEDAYCFECGSGIATEGYDCTCQCCRGSKESQCDNCGNYWDTDDMYYLNSENICPDCRDQYYFECPDCGELFHNDYAHYNSLFGVNLCDRCHGAIMHNSSNEYDVMFLSNYDSKSTDDAIETIKRNDLLIGEMFNQFTNIRREDKYLAINEYFNIYSMIGNSINKSLPYDTHTHWSFSEIVNMTDKPNTRANFNDYFNEYNIGKRSIVHLYGIATRGEMLFLKELIENSEMKPKVIFHEERFVELSANIH